MPGTTIEIRRQSLELDAEVRFEATFQNANVGLAHVGLDGEWLRVNARLVEMLGYSEQEMLEISFADITHPDDLAADVDLLQQLNNGKLDRYTVEKRYYRKNGKLIWVTLQVAPQNDQAGVLRYYIFSITNITVTKKLEKKLLDAALDIERLMHVLGHELRNSINGISVNAQLIEATGRSEPLPEIVASSVEAIQSNVKAAADFLAYVEKMAAFQTESEESDAVSLAVAVELVLVVSAVSLSETSTSVVIPEPLPNVLGQRIAIARVLQNLIDNAVKYRRLDLPCTITITAETKEDEVLLKIQDTGRGIPKDQLQHVFQAAWRATNVGTATGRGLGLAFCHRIMETLDGAISVTSDEATGTCFTLTFNSAP